MGNESKYLILASMQDFHFTLTHSDTLNVSRTVYSFGGYIKFTLTFNTQKKQVKGVIQKCWTTSNGITNQYVLISNIYLFNVLSMFFRRA